MTGHNLEVWMVQASTPGGQTTRWRGVTADDLAETVWDAIDRSPADACISIIREDLP